MRPFNHFKNHLLRFWQDESGVAAPLIGLAFIVLVGSTGLAIDAGRAQLVQSKLSSALDAAGLAAGATVSTQNVTTEVNKYLYANFPVGYMDATINTVTVQVSPDSSTINLAATATMPTTLMKVLGQNTVDISATSQITRASRGLELVMVLDNTGSMSGSKLTDLKNAATTMVNSLYGSKSTVDDLWIGLVPFSQGVNIGSSRGSWTDNTAFNWGNPAVPWGGCVEARTASNRDTTDDPPSVALFRKYYWGDDGNNDWLTSGGNTRSGTNASGSSIGPNRSCPQVVTPMTGNKTTILNAITAMQAVGNTHINDGAVWGWRMLSPRWQNLWGGEMNANGLPLAYNTPLMNKAAIIMSDGDNVISNTSDGSYGYLSAGVLGTTNQGTAETRLDQRLTTVCTAMKNNNIYVYTILFGTGISAATQTLMRNCATQPDFYFNAPTTATLQTAFKAIGDSLANLRVSK
jgi:Flp pilus assembly protein TadG